MNFKTIKPIHCMLKHDVRKLRHKNIQFIHPSIHSIYKYIQNTVMKTEKSIRLLRMNGMSERDAKWKKRQINE